MNCNSNEHTSHSEDSLQKCKIQKHSPADCVGGIVEGQHEDSIQVLTLITLGKPQGRPDAGLVLGLCSLSKLCIHSCHLLKDFPQFGQCLLLLQEIHCRTDAMGFLASYLIDENQKPPGACSMTAIGMQSDTPASPHVHHHKGMEHTHVPQPQEGNGDSDGLLKLLEADSSPFRRWFRSSFRRASWLPTTA